MDHDHDLTLIAERLVTDFSGCISLTTVLSVLRDCADRYPDGQPEIVEQATRMQLQIRNQGHSQ